MNSMTYQIQMSTEDCSLDLAYSDLGKGSIQLRMPSIITEAAEASVCMKSVLLGYSYGYKKKRQLSFSHSMPHFMKVKI